MANLPDNKKKIKISISIDYELNEKLEEISQKDGFYKKSRLIESILKKYLENDNKFKES